MEYAIIAVIFGFLTLPLIYYFIAHMDAASHRHDKIIENDGKEKRNAAADAHHNLPKCACRRCGHVWISGRKDVLPSECPECGKKEWWWAETEYDHYSFLKTVKPG